MNSFYGGKQGLTYHIVARFDSVAAMVEAFQQGGAYRDVNYGQYVIIDTVLHNHNPNSDENGRLYRRGFDYSAQPPEEGTEEEKILNPGGGAIYVGQIRGADGKIPDLSLTTIDGINEIVNDTTGKYEIINNAIIIASPSTRVAINEQGTTEGIELGYVTYREKENGKYGDYKGKLAIDIPKPVVRVNASTVSAYGGTLNHTGIDGTTDEWEAGDSDWSHQHSLSVEAAEDGVTYYDYQIAVPMGKKGDSVENLELLYDSSQDKYYLKTIIKNYDDSAEGSTTTYNTNTDIQLVEDIRIDPNGGEKLQYHRSNDFDTQGNPIWHDIGILNGQFHVYKFYDDLQTLQAEYPNGIVDIVGGQPDYTHAGWLVVVKETVGDEEVSSLYAFDYNSNQWKKLQDFSDGLFDPSRLFIVDNQSPTNPLEPMGDYQNLITGGLWVVTKNKNVEAWYKEEEEGINSMYYQGEVG